MAVDNCVPVNPFQPQASASAVNVPFQKSLRPTGIRGWPCSTAATNRGWHRLLNLWAKPKRLREAVAVASTPLCQVDGGLATTGCTRVAQVLEPVGEAQEVE